MHSLTSRKIYVTLNIRMIYFSISIVYIKAINIPNVHSLLAHYNNLWHLLPTLKCNCELIF